MPRPRRGVAEAVAAAEREERELATAETCGRRGGWRNWPRGGAASRPVWPGWRPRTRNGAGKSRASSPAWALLEEMERTYQGYFPGVRSVLVEARNEPFAAGIRGLVAELISVKAGYEVALEVALGSALQFVVLEDDAQAQAAIAYLKRSGRGRATFLPLNMVRGNRATASGLAEAMKDCGAHYAADLLEYAPEYRGIIDHLLGNTLVAPDLAQAVALAKRTGRSFRIVTKEGRGHQRRRAP